MTQAIAIMKRELVARRDLFLLAAALMVLAILMPLVPGTSNYQAANVRSLTSQFLALLLGCGVAIGLGVSVFGRDLSGDRLGFFFARPVASRSVWFGRMAASVITVLVCEVVVLLPALVVEAGQLVLIDSHGWWLLILAFIFIPVFLVFFSHALSIMGSARSAWLFLDLIGLAAVAVGIWLALRPLYLLGAVDAVLVVGTVVALAALVALFLAGWAGIAVGRTDPHRSHGALSVTLWLLLAAAVVGSLSGSSWLRDFTPAEMQTVDVWSVSPDGRWIEVWGSAPRRLDVHRRALVSTLDDRHVMLPPYWNHYLMEAMYSADGNIAVGFNESSGRGGPNVLWWVDLRSRSPEIVESLLVVPPGTLTAVSADGSLVAFVEGGILSVHELASESLAAAARLPSSYEHSTMIFLGNERLRFYSRPGGVATTTIRIAEYDVGEGRFDETGRIEEVVGGAWMALDAEGEHLVLGVQGEEGASRKRFLHNAVNGTRIRELDSRTFPRLLSNGRLVSMVGENGMTRLLVESMDGETRIEHPLAQADWEGLGGEALPGQVLVGRLEALEDRGDGRAYHLVDVESGETSPVAMGLRRVHSAHQWVSGRASSVFWYVNSPEANRIFTDRTGAVVRWEPDTGAMVHIVGGEAD
jgi:hypothetical protein